MDSGLHGRIRGFHTFACDLVQGALGDPELGACAAAVPANSCLGIDVPALDDGTEAACNLVMNVERGLACLKASGGGSFPCKEEVLGAVEVDTRAQANAFYCTRRRPPLFPPCPAPEVLTGCQAQLRPVADAFAAKAISPATASLGGGEIAMLRQICASFAGYHSCLRTSIGGDDAQFQRCYPTTDGSFGFLKSIFNVFCKEVLPSPPRPALSLPFSRLTFSHASNLYPGNHGGHGRTCSVLRQSGKDAHRREVPRRSHRNGL